MNAKSNWARTRIVILVALGLLLVADVAAGVLWWRTSRQDPAEMRAELKGLELRAKLGQADVARGQKIRESLPQVQKDCDKFYQTAFLDEGSGYSSVDADLGSIAEKAGLRISDTTYKPKDAKTHGVKEISISTTVEGSYSAIIQFISGLERSKNFYLLNDLQLNSAKDGAIRLQLKLRTFFRS
jgi:Tfp pilus assembly protein PilO